MSAHSAGAYTATLLVRVNVMRGGGRAPPTLTSQNWFYPHHWMNARKQRLQLCVLCVRNPLQTTHFQRRHCQIIFNFNRKLIPASLLASERHYRHFLCADLLTVAFVADPDPPDPHDFGPPGSGSTSQRYGSGSGSGSGSFYHHAKIVRKTLILTILWLFLTFYLWKMM